MIRKILFLLSFIFVISLQANEPLFLSLKGYLGKEEIDKASQILNQTHQPSSLIVEVNSSTGEIDPVLAFAKKIYELKEETGLKVIVYINDHAIGPAAIIPFLADELYTSLFVSWGDITQGAEGTVSTNFLRNRVSSLVNPNNPHADFLQNLAAAMSDKSIQSPVSGAGETAVINQNQLKKFNLVAGILNPAKFQEKFAFSQTQSHLMQQAAVVLSPELPQSLILERLKAHIPFDPNGTNTIGYLVIDDRTSGISDATWLYIKNGLDYYKKIKPDFIILELNTPGGEVYSSQKISDALKELDTQFNIPVVTFINNWAISAGAMLAFSSRFIVTTKDGSMGAAEPVIGSQMGEMKEASEKVNSAMRTDFANRASFFGRNPALAEAMVDKDVILVMRHGKIMKLDSESQIRSTGSDPDHLISSKGKLLTLNADQMISYGVADLLLSPKPIEALTAEENAKGKWPASKMLLFSAPFFNTIPHAVIDQYQMDWKTRFFVFLANPIVSSILFLGMMLGFYLELSTPGVSLPGIIGGICLFLIILSSFALEIGNVLELILLFTGILILLVELFILPTFGFLGFIGIFLFLAGLFGLMVPGLESFHFELDTQTLNAAGEAVLNRIAWLLATFFAGLVIIALLARYVVPSFSGWTKLVLTGNEQDASRGFIAGENPADLPKPGTKGVAFTSLRPAGKVMIHDVIYDAISNGTYIDRDEPIVVLEIDGSVLIIKSDKTEEGLL